MSIAALLSDAALKRDEPLAKYTAARLGGPADWLYIARDNDPEGLARRVMSAWQADIPVTLLGGGANVLIADAGIRGLTVINRQSDVQFGAWHAGRRVAVMGGTALSVLAKRCQKAGLAGMEWAVGVPGTVGGAIVNNAGAHGVSMADSVADVVVVQPAGPHLLNRADLDYDYRHSALKARSDRRFLVLMATLMLTPDDPAAIQARMDAYNAYRKRTQPPGASLGSIFKNPPGDYAGRLIEAAGLKGARMGAVQVSEKHANFFVNLGEGTRAADYDALIHHVQGLVRDQSGITLELEIERLGDW